jgi:flagellar motor switch protein FliN
MDEHTCAIIADHLVKGMAETIQAMLGGPLEFLVQETGTITTEQMAEEVEAFPIVLAATLANDSSGVALLLRREVALQLAAMLQDEQEPAPHLGDVERGVLRDLTEAVLGSGVANLLESLGQEFGQLKQTRVLEDEEAVRTLPEFLGEQPVLCRLQFQDNEQLEGPALLLFSQSFEDLAPSQAPERAAPSPLLTEEEMQDILGGIGLPMEEHLPHSSSPAEYGENLEMVLDISLTAVARLGGIEMPIGEILALGPGAIIEVGHLVDEPVELLVNDRLIARGEVVVVDEKFGLRITEIISPRMRIESLR